MIAPSAELQQRLAKRLEQPSRCGCAGEYAGHDSCRDRRLLEEAVYLLASQSRALEEAQREIEQLEQDRHEAEQGEAVWKARAEQAEAARARLQEALTERIAALEAAHGTAESCGWHDGLTYNYDMEAAAAFNELKRLMALAIPVRPTEEP